MKYKYVIIVKFFAGSDDVNDIDEGIYLFQSNKEYTLSEMKETFKKVNSLLDVYNEDRENFPISYNDGLNLDTLIEGIKIYTKDSIKKVDNYSGSIDGIYVVEQCQ